MNTLQESVPSLGRRAGSAGGATRSFSHECRHFEEKARRDVREDYGVEEPNAPGDPVFFAKNSVRRQVIDLSADTAKISASMVTFLLHLLRLLPMLCGGHRQVALENLALRH